MGTVTAACKAVADSGRFQAFIIGVIVANAITLGLGTYSGIEADAGSLLGTLDDAFLAIFVVELTIRVLAYGRRPQDFFRDGWNLFDFVVVAAAFAPGVRENVTMLRLARLLRVVRVVSIFPDLRGIVRAMVRSLPPITSLAVLTILIMYVYGMVGWILFHAEDPENWGNIGEAMLTLFTMLTLENWPDVLSAGQAIHPASWIFFVSYVLVASFLVINILLAIIINSMEEVREVERRAEREARALDQRKGGVLGEAALAAETAEAIAERMQTLRDALDDLEGHLGGESAGQSRRTGGQMTTKARLKP